VISFNKIYHSDCFELFEKIEGNSIDLILIDPPYQITDHSWDQQLSFDKLWKEYSIILKKNSVAVIFGTEPFSSNCRLSNRNWYKFDFVWDKKIPSGMSYAKYQPMRQHENIMVFCNGKLPYYPQMTKRDKPIKSGGQKSLNSEATQLDKYKIDGFSKTYEYKNPTSILSFMKVRKGALHPTEKPVELLEYLIRTFSKENDLVLDNCCGSGSTCIAAMNCNRNFIGIEKEEKYFTIAKERLEKHAVSINSHSNL